MARTAMAVVLLGLIAVGSPADDDPGPIAPAESFRDDQRAHWAFQPPSRPEPPEFDRPGEPPAHPIDRFIQDGLRVLEFRAAPEADRRSLARRVTFDLTGLPPTPEEVEAFVADRSADAYERLVDRLLASPRFGERWAQHWLDLAHYADSNGFELDADRPDAWRYRDWVVRAFNDDTPYDEFLSLQVAGDELRPGDPGALIATGFGRCGPREVVGGNIDPAVRRQSELTEVTGTVGSVFLGLTVACARCHDHKFDPIPTTDYYRLQSFFAGAEFEERPIAADGDQEAYDGAMKAIAERARPFREQLAVLEKPFRQALRDRKEASLTAAERAVLAVPEADRTELQKTLAMGANKVLNVTWEEVAAAVAADPDRQADRERLKRAIHEVELDAPRPPAKAMALAESKNEAPESFVLRRGEVDKPGPRVAPRPPGIALLAMGADAFDPAAIAPGESTSGRRAALARWLTRPDNPLVARVIVNRLWQHHYGRGLVATTSDFGTRGDEPSHPELLDWLAADLVDGGWKLKRLHRLMVTSAAYRRASAPRPEDRDWWAQQAEDDPENALVWRGARRRLEAEGLRDAMLAVTGELNPTAGGPGVLVPIEPEVEALIFTEAEVVDLWPETPDPAEHARRSLYLFRKRNVRYPMFDAFDAPDTQLPCARRDVSTHALQPLELLNSRFAIDRAKALAGRLGREADDPSARIDRAYRLVLARPPRESESAAALAFLAEQTSLLRDRAAAGEPLAAPTPFPAGADPAGAAAWVDFAAAMLNRNEFVYVP